MSDCSKTRFSNIPQTKWNLWASVFFFKLFFFFTKEYGSKNVCSEYQSKEGLEILSHICHKSWILILTFYLWIYGKMC